MFKMLGFGDVSTVEAWTIMLSAVALALIVGWVLDMVADRVAFGVFGNAVVCLLAIAVALVAYRSYVGEVSVGKLPMVMGAATLSVVVHLFTFVFLRRALKL